MKPSAQPVLVMGMHRSGTSCVTGLLEAFGMSLGPSESLMPATKDNPLGYFENIQFNRLCIDLLKSSGADWWKVRQFDVADIPVEHLAKARGDIEELKSVLEHASAYALKDPRFCFLLPALRSSFPGAVFLHVVRSPIEVAMSLNARDGFGLAEGIALWEAYNRAALGATAQEKRLLLSYGALVESPETAGRQLWAELADLGVPGLTPLSEIDFAAHVDKDLHRQKSGDHGFDGLLTASQQGLWEALGAGVFPSLEESDENRRHRDMLLASLETQVGVQTERVGSARGAEAAKSQEARRRELNALQEAARMQGAQIDELGTQMAITLEMIERLYGVIADASATESDARAAHHREISEQIEGHAQDVRRELETYRAEMLLYRAELRTHLESSPFARWRKLGRRSGSTAPAGSQDLTASNVSADFDESFYLLKYPDVAAAGLEPLAHYLRFGWKEGRTPHPDIDNATFLQRHPEVKGRAR